MNIEYLHISKTGLGDREQNADWEMVTGVWCTPIRKRLMKKTTTLLAVFFYCITSLFAVGDLHLKYNWEAKPVPTILTENEKKEPSVIILDNRFFEYVLNDEGNLDRYVIKHKIIKINEAKSVEEYNKIYIPMYGLKEKVNVKARTINADGKIRELKDEDFKEIEDNDGGEKYLAAAVDGLEVGSEVEYFYILKTNTNPFGTEYYQQSVFTRKANFKIISPENLLFEAKGYNGIPETKNTADDSAKIIETSIENIPVVDNESYAFRTGSLMRIEYKISFNTNNPMRGKLYTWQDAADKYVQLYYTFDKDSRTVAKTIIKKAGLKKGDTREKVRKLEAWLKTNIAISKEMDDKEIPLSIALRNKVASDAMVLKMYLVTLGKLEIQTEIAATTNRSDRRFDPDFQTWNYLGENFIYIPEIKQFIVPGDAASRMGIIPFGYINNDAIFMRAVVSGNDFVGQYSIGKIPPTTKEENTELEETEVSFDAKMRSTTTKVKYSLTGYLAFYYRPVYYSLNDEKKSQIANDLLKRIADDGKVTNIKTWNYNINSEDIYKPFILEGDVASNSIIEKADEKTIFKIGLLLGAQSEMYQDKPRKLDLEMNFPHSYHRIIKVNIPEGYTAKNLEGLNMNFSYAEAGKTEAAFTSNYNLSGNLLTVDVIEYYNQPTYPASSYNEFRKVINAAADFNKLTVVLEKK
ncbi:MAG: DUF3857 domain-containing protein [Bacteroidetes bacterium]|nr:DUF3857 domain-containing protein [Bacteroidota bacterium]